MSIQKVQAVWRGTPWLSEELKVCETRVLSMYDPKIEQKDFFLKMRKRTAVEVKTTWTVLGLMLEGEKAQSLTLSPISLVGNFFS